jgi:predicted TIM-barrel fold metal-dependent hydrolase
LPTAEPVFDPYYVRMYGPMPDERFPIPAVDLKQLKPTHFRAEVPYQTTERPGTIVVSTPERYLYLVQEGGRLHLPIHIHTAIGIGDYFNLSQSNIMNLESVLRDPRYASTTFVMIHGGYPLEREAIWLAAMKNVYLDTSFGELAQYPSAFKNTLKMFLETFPDKITFGTDCFPYNQVLGAEESYWLGAQSSRMALAAALAEMISEGEITESRALELAHAYLHDTAVKLYGGRVH